MRQPEPSREEIGRYLALDFRSPSGLVWKARPESPQYARRHGQPAGSRKDNGYWRVMINGKWWFAHRLVWVLSFMGPIPPGHEVDHRDGNRENNRPENLRLARPAENKANRKGWGALGQRNIRFLPNRPKRPFLVEVSCTHQGLRSSLSRSFANLGEAIEWRDKVRARFWGEFAERHHHRGVQHATV